MGDPVAIGDTHARRGAVPGEHAIAAGIGLAQVDELPIGGLDNPYIVEF